MTTTKTKTTHWCKDRVYGRGFGFGSPCSNKAKYDPDENGVPTKCWSHSTDRKKKDDERREREYHRREYHRRNARRRVKEQAQNRYLDIVAQALPRLADEEMDAFLHISSNRLWNAIQDEKKGRTS